MGSKQMSESATPAARLADKVWRTLFGGGDGAAMASWQAQRRPQDRARVREAELKAIAAMHAELDDLHAGRKAFNRAGEIVDVVVDRAVSRVALNSIIEVQEEDPLAGLQVPDTAEALRAVRLEADIGALRRSLNVRRIGLRAEALAEESGVTALSERAVDADWLLRWQEAAARAVAVDFQDLWARVLVDEVRQPGTHSLRTLSFLATLSRADVETIRIVSRLDLGGFVCREAPGYFHDDIHAPMFALLEDMGLMASDPAAEERLPTTAASGLKVVLRCHDKALQVEGVGEALVLPARRCTRLGAEVLALFGDSGDPAYLFAVGNGLRQRGYRIAFAPVAALGG